MARRKDACAKCGGAVAAGVLICATCMVAATPAQAKPAPSAPQPRVVKMVTAEQIGRYRFYTIGEQKALGPLPTGSSDDHDMPEPDATFYTPGIFAAGTAISTNPGR
jgi:hypothetical protein